MIWPFPTVTNPRTPTASEQVKPQRKRKAAQATPQRKAHHSYPANAAKALL